MAVNVLFNVSSLPQHAQTSGKIPSDLETHRNQTHMLVGKNQILQDWDGPGDPEDPLNWPLWKQVYHTAMVGDLRVTIYASTLYDSF